MLFFRRQQAIITIGESKFLLTTDTSKRRKTDDYNESVTTASLSDAMHHLNSLHVIVLRIKVNERLIFIYRDRIKMLVKAIEDASYRN